MIRFLVAVFFSSPLFSMERSPVSKKPSKDPGKYLTLDVMAAAKGLRDGAPQKWISSDDVVEFCVLNGIDDLCAHRKNKAIHATLRFFFGITESPIQCFTASIFARDSSSFFASDADKQYVGRHHAIQALSDTEKLLEGKWGVAAPPLFSPNGRWLVGWESLNRLAMRDLDQFVTGKDLRDGPVDDTWKPEKGVISDKPITYLSLHEENDLEDRTADYALDNKTIIIQKGRALFCGALSDVAKRGIEALQKVYTGSQNFQAPQRYKVIHALSDGSVATIGQDAIRVFTSIDGVWNCVRSYPIKLASDDMVVVNAHRGIAAVTKKKSQVRFYALVGSDAGKKGRIKIENLIPESCAFSPAGLMFVLQASNSYPEIFNCSRLKKILKARLCDTADFNLAMPATWNTQGIIGYHTNVLGGTRSKEMSILNTTRGFSILEAYLLHKEATKNNGKIEQE